MDNRFLTSGVRARVFWPAWLVLGAALLATLLVSLYVKKRIDADAVRRFAVTADQVALKIQERLNAYALMLRGSAALFTASDHVDRHEWREYIELQRSPLPDPGLKGMGYIPLISRAQLPQVVGSVRREGLTDYSIHPPGERDTYAPVQYLEPMVDRNRRFLGFDMQTDAGSLAAMERARDTEEVAITSKVSLALEMDEEGEAGIRLFAPIYASNRPHETVTQRRSALRGWVYSSYRIDNILASISMLEMGHAADLHIYDGQLATPDALLFDSKSHHLRDKPSAFYQQRVVGLNRHRFLLVLDHPDAVSGISYTPLWGTGVAGLMLSALFFGLVLLAINTRVHAQAIAARLTSDVRQREQQLQESESKLSTILENVEAFIYLKDPQGRYLFANRPVRQLFGVSLTDIVGQTDAQFFDASTAASLRKNDLAVLAHGERISAEEFNLNLSDGKQSHYLSVKVPLRKPDGSIYALCGISTDITQIKQMQAQREEALKLLQKVANRVPGMVYQFRLRPDGSGCFPFVSDAIRDLYGLAPDDVKESSEKIRELWHPDDSQGVQDSILKSAKDLTPWHHEYRVRLNDGTVRWLLGNSVPERESDGSTLWHGFVTDVTDRKQAEARIARSHSLLSATLESTNDGILVVNLDSLWVLHNQPFLALWKIPPHILATKDRRTALAFVRAQLHDGDEFLRKVADLNARPDESSFDVLKFKDGRTLESYSFPQRLAGEVIGRVWNFREVTERVRAEEKMQLAASVFHHAREGIMITSPQGSILDVNDAFTTITGYERTDVMGQNPRMLSSGMQSTDFYRKLWQELLQTGHWYGEVWNRRKDGQTYATMQTISAVRNEKLQTLHYVSLFSDITALKHHEQQLEHIAHYDPLTHLPNRVLLADRLQQAIRHAQGRGKLLAVAYLDLDGFKQVNDSQGHDVGDQLLMHLASMMKTVLREGDTLARLGGDEFVAVMRDLDNVAMAVPMLEGLLQASSKALLIDGHPAQVSGSVGVTFYPQHEEVDADQLLRQADQAMYQAKLAGKNRFHIFDADQDRSVRGFHESVEHIRAALAQNEFVLHYQPKVNMRTGKLVGAEALIRWQHPEQGLLPPAKFLPVIEGHALSVEVGEWVIATALQQTEAWHAAGLDITVSVNIGARQLQQPNFVERLKALMAPHARLRPFSLEIEVLETSALEDMALATTVLTACKDMGINFSLDDFGTGYSSLTYLKRLPVFQVKIDQSFVRDMLDDPDDLAILAGILSLASAFHREVIAEGVETIEHGQMLLQLGCDLAQGYGIARPMPANLLLGWARQWHPDPAWVNVSKISHEELPQLFARVEQNARARQAERQFKQPA